MMSRRRVLIGSAWFGRKGKSVGDESQSIDIFDLFMERGNVKCMLTPKERHSCRI